MLQTDSDRVKLGVEPGAHMQHRHRACQRSRYQDKARGLGSCDESQPEATSLPTVEPSLRGSAKVCEGRSFFVEL